MASSTKNVGLKASSTKIVGLKASSTKNVVLNRLLRQSTNFWYPSKIEFWIDSYGKSNIPPIWFGVWSKTLLR